MGEPGDGFLLGRNEPPTEIGRFAADLVKGFDEGVELELLELEFLQIVGRRNGLAIPLLLQ